MKYLFLDCETTGLIPKKANWDINYLKYPYIVSLSWVLYIDEDLINEQNFIVKPKGYIIPENTIKIHKINNEIAKKDGKNIKIVLEKLRQDLKDVDFVVGFNTYFDTSVIKANILRYNYDIKDFISKLDKNKRIDLMRLTQKYFKKYPKLTELYFKLFREKYNAHNSLSDVEATARCFFELRKIGLII